MMGDLGDRRGGKTIDHQPRSQAWSRRLAAEDSRPCQRRSLGRGHRCLPFTPPARGVCPQQLQDARRTRQEGFRRTIQKTHQLTAVRPEGIAWSHHWSPVRTQRLLRLPARGAICQGTGATFRNWAADGWRDQGRLSLTAAGPASDCWAWSPPCAAPLSGTRAQPCRPRPCGAVRPPWKPAVTVRQRR